MSWLKLNNPLYGDIDFDQFVCNAIPSILNYSSKFNIQPQSEHAEEHNIHDQDTVIVETGIVHENVPIGKINYEKLVTQGNIPEVRANPYIPENYYGYMRNIRGSPAYWNCVTFVVLRTFGAR